jgi:prepilin-type N-terminal cleavage/methylation domain-containing protein
MTIMRNITSRRYGAQAGFTLIEALIALVVMAFGMLALSGMQLSLSRNADVAKQRTEAMRLAQRKIDEYRAFTSIAPGAGHTIVWNSLPASAVETVTTNAAFSVTTTLGGVIADAMRTVNVTVAWADRTSTTNNQQISISSVISKSDPIDIGYVSNPLPLNTPLKRPKNRNINIPIPALDLGGGQSSTQFSPDYVIVYSNVTAGVVKICDPVTATSTATVPEINAAIAGTSGSCVDVTGYIVAGYVGRSTSSVAWPTGLNVAGLTRDQPFAGQAIRCLYSDATDQNTGSVITANNGYKYYLCVVPVSDPFLWSGTMRLGGVSTSTNYLVCRYQYGAQAGLTANERNVQPYNQVNLSMDEQNYKVVTSSNSGATSLVGSTSACPADMTVTDATLGSISVGVVHQDCRTQNPSRATECPASSTFP